MEEFKHIPVLLNEVIDGLKIRKDGIYVDCTIGGGGHSEQILKRLSSKGHLYGIDKDEDALLACKERLKGYKNLTLIYSDYKEAHEILLKKGIESFDGLLIDLGVSSYQLDTAERGFSFLREGHLDMRMDKSNKLTAEKVVNTYSLEELTNIFYLYGEEKQSKLIAKKIVSYRLDKPIKTTTELVKIIMSAVGAKYFNKNHPERQIFQAIRIEVNSELTVLKKVLPDAIDLLNKGGRIAVITFHSLEDRIVKQIFKKESEINDLVKGLPDIPKEYQPKIKLINKKPIIPSEAEIKENTRSKSAKLRIIERL